MPINPSPHPRRALLAAVTLTLAGGLNAQAAHAQSADAYPSRPVRIIVPFAAGGSTDIVARMTAGALSKELGQPFVVENRPGASGNIGAELVAKAAPDGHTLLFTTTNLTMNPAITKSLPYDAVADFKPITMVAFAPLLLIKGPGVKADSITRLVDEIRAKPGSFNFSSSGKGGAPHLAGEMFRLNNRLQMVHVPYNGAAPALNDVASGQVQLTFTTYVSAKALLDAGKVSAIGVTSRERLSALPNVPTFAEAGLKDMETGTMFGLLAPSSTPQRIVTRLYDALAKAARSPEFTARLVEQGSNPVLNTPADYTTYVREDVERWKSLISKIGSIE